MWGPFYEKIFAKFHGNYAHTIGGWPTTAVRNIINSPTIYEVNNQSITANELWDALKKYDEAHDIIQAGTSGGDDSMTSKTGIVLGHAYVVVGVVELSTGDRLVKLRNPWGKEKYIGDWSDSSDKWTEKLR